MAIMPSKYTDEIENLSYILGGYFLWVGIQNIVQKKSYRY